MLWIKAFHIISMVTWFAGLFYLPRLYVYHASATDRISIDRFKVMERKLFFGIMTPGAILTVATGAWMWIGYGFSGDWLLAKLAVVALVIVHHVWCYRQLVLFRNEKSSKSHVYYRWMNEVPVIYLLIIVVLVVVKPF
jgi:putative membrane protein